MAVASPSVDAEALEPLLELLRGRRAVVLAGAGCSTESGIPDYRGPGAAAPRAAGVGGVMEPVEGGDVHVRIEPFRLIPERGDVQPVLTLYPAGQGK